LITLSHDISGWLEIFGWREAAWPSRRHPANTERGLSTELAEREPRSDTSKFIDMPLFVKGDLGFKGGVDLLSWVGSIHHSFAYKLNNEIAKPGEEPVFIA
jgi:hypothetical protein